MRDEDIGYESAQPESPREGDAIVILWFIVALLAIVAGGYVFTSIVEAMP